jgi:ABC-type nickel/cobalt efflux system permease component RcnA
LNGIAVVSVIFMTAAVLSAIATVCVLRSAAYSTIQKLLQIALVWLLPFVGAIAVLSVWAHDRKFTSPRPVHPDEGPWLPGIGPESDHRHHGADAGESGGHGGDGVS